MTIDVAGPIPSLGRVRLSDYPPLLTALERLSTKYVLLLWPSEAIDGTSWYEWVDAVVWPRTWLHPLPPRTRRPIACGLVEPAQGPGAGVAIVPGGEAIPIGGIYVPERDIIDMDATTLAFEAPNSLGALLPVVWFSSGITHPHRGRRRQVATRDRLWPVRPMHNITTLSAGVLQRTLQPGLSILAHRSRRAVGRAVRTARTGIRVQTSRLWTLSFPIHTTAGQLIHDSQMVYIPRLWVDGLP